MELTGSRWAGRFIGMTFALGGVAWVIFALLVLGNVLAGMGNYALGPASSRIVAGGGAGSWFTMGILAYLIVAVGGTGSQRSSISTSRARWAPPSWAGGTSVRGFT